MKRITAALLVLLLILSMMSGCGKKEDVTDGEGVNTESETEQTPENTEGGNESSDNKTQSGANNQTNTTKPDKNNTTGDSSNDKPASNNNSGSNSQGNTNSGSSNNTSSNSGSGTTSKPSGNNASTDNSGNSTANGGGSSVSLPSDWESGDADTDDFVPDATDGEIDMKAEFATDNTKYETNVPTSMKYTEITSDTYDEAKLKLPIIKINTLDGGDVTSKTAYKNATINISNTDLGYQKKDFAVEIRGRGNSTWAEFEKKPYKLKFGVKTDMFGMGAAKKWVLLANSMDETMVRNYLAFTLAQKLGLEFTSEFRYINLFINDEYKGVYILCEQLQEGSTRVDVNTSKTGEVDTGYLLEGINSRASVEERTFSVPTVAGQTLGKNNNFQFIIKSPDSLTCSNEQFTFISDYIKQVNEAIFTKNWEKITSLVDINSFVNMFILDMVTLNNDMGYSFYMYKKAGGKLYLGPMWDYDQSFGNSSHGGSGYKGWYAGSKHQWYTTLIEMDQFKTLVKNRYKDKKSDITGLVGEIDKVITQNSYDFAMNNYLWDYNFGSKDRWRITYELVGLTTYKQNVEFLKTWLTNRLRWMEHALGVS